MPNERVSRTAWRRHRPGTSSFSNACTALHAFFLGGGGIEGGENCATWRIDGNVVKRNGAAQQTKRRATTETTMVTVTKEFLNDNRTVNGAWTRAQLQAVGVRWPLKSGWMDRIVGTEISDAQAEEFILASGIYSNSKFAKRKARQRENRRQRKTDAAKSRQKGG